MSKLRDPHDRYETATLYIAKVLQVMHGHWPNNDLALLLSLADNELDSLYLGEKPSETDLEYRKRAAAICRTPDEDILAGKRTPHATDEYTT